MSLRSVSWVFICLFVCSLDRLWFSCLFWFVFVFVCLVIFVVVVIVETWVKKKKKKPPLPIFVDWLCAGEALHQSVQLETPGPVKLFLSRCLLWACVCVLFSYLEFPKQVSHASSQEPIIFLPSGNCLRSWALICHGGCIFFQ